MLEMFATILGTVVILAVGAIGALYFGAISVESIKELIYEHRSRKKM